MNECKFPGFEFDDTAFKTTDLEQELHKQDKNDSNQNCLRAIIDNLQLEVTKYPKEVAELRKREEYEKNGEHLMAFNNTDSYPFGAIYDSPSGLQINQTITSTTTASSSSSSNLYNYNRRTHKGNTIDIHDVRFLKPFKYGWQREIVYRSMQNDQLIVNQTTAYDGQQRKRKSDIYYYSPSGKKARSYREIQMLLHDDLTIENFTFAKDTIGVKGEMEREACVRSGARNASQAYGSAATVATVSSSGGSMASKSKSRSKNRNRHINSSSSDYNVQNHVQPEPVFNHDIDMKPTDDELEAPAASVPNVILQIDARFEKHIPRRSLLQDTAYAYSTLVDIFRLLRTQDLLSCSRVCRMWHSVAAHDSMWERVVMKNSSLVNLEGMIQALKRHRTRELDLRKMLISKSLAYDPVKFWHLFGETIGQLDDDLLDLKMGRCPASVLQSLADHLPHLRSLQACQVDGKEFDFGTFGKFTELQEFKLKPSTETIEIIGNGLESFNTNQMCLQTLSLLSLNNLNCLNLRPLVNIQTLKVLELGEFTNMNDDFAHDVLRNLQNLRRLRLENGKNTNLCAVTNELAEMTQLHELELINVDVRGDFDTKIAKCTNLRKLLIVPNYITLSATTNQLVLNGISKLKDTLEMLVWVITVELLRVTELFVDQCEESLQNKIKKQQQQYVSSSNPNTFLANIPLPVNNTILANGAGATSTSSLSSTSNQNSNSCTDSIPVLKPILLNYPGFALNGGGGNVQDPAAGNETIKSEESSSSAMDVDQMPSIKAKTSVANDNISPSDDTKTTKTGTETSSATAASSAQVEILALNVLHRMLNETMPRTDVRITKVPFSATWKQTLT